MSHDSKKSVPIDGKYVNQGMTLPKLQPQKAAPVKITTNETPKTSAQPVKTNTDKK